MAGGIGSRFWPESRESRPKQFIDILGTGQSLIQLTYERAKAIVPKENILIVSHKMYRELILQQLPELSADQLLLEPSRNNTAPCVAYTALHLKAKNPEAVFAMLPSDHIIMLEEVFSRHLKTAFDFAANNDAIVTLGIKPSRPDTGYGYINFEREDGTIFKVKEFKEKPDEPTAVSYINSGDYLWNAGIFVWSVKTILNAFEKSCADILNVLDMNNPAFGSSGEQDYIDQIYPSTPSISVDYAILEKAKNVYTIPADIGWSDLGTWNSLYDFLPKDKDQNVVIAEHHDLDLSEGNLVRSSDKKKLIVVKGLKDYIIIDDNDVLMIYPRHEEQQIKQLKAKFDNTPFV